MLYIQYKGKALLLKMLYIQCKGNILLPIRFTRVKLTMHTLHREVEYIFIPHNVGESEKPSLISCSLSGETWNRVSI